MTRPHHPAHGIRLAALLVGLAGLSHVATVAAAPAPAASPAADCLFNWAEIQYPALFAPSGGGAQVEGSYYYRAYAESGYHLGVANGRVWMASAGSADIADLGALTEWLATAGCGTADTTAPRVLYTSRSDGSVDAALNARVAAAFSEPVETSGTLADTLTVSRDDGTPVSGSASYDAATATLYFDPAGDLDGGRTYTARLNANLRDLAGNALSAYSWQFQTAAGKRNSATQNTLQLTLDRAVWRYSIPGATMAVLESDGNLWTAASGYANLTTREPMTTDLRFRIGSNTKTLVATAVLQLVDAGKVSLDAPIDTYLANELSAYLSAYDGSRITVRQLLNHTSGIFNFTVDPAWGEAFVSDATKRYYPQELLLIANSHAADANAPVFGSFTYSNTNYVLLGLLLRNAGGTVYDDVVRTGITVPLGLNDTIVPHLGDAVPPADTAHGYWEDSETGILYDVSVKDPSTVWSSGDIISDIDDLTRWGQALGQGTLLSASSQSARLTYVDMDDHLQYGLGVVRDRRANLIGHQGGMIGYTSQTYYVPDVGATLSFFYNRTLALHDYSDVMTYDALEILWPERYGNIVRSGTRSFGKPRTQGRPGFLSEY